MSSPAAIDIVIVNYRSAGDTLGAVAGLVPWPHGTIWVVDNSEDAVEVERLKAGTSAHPEVRLLVQARNIGFGAGCNAAYDLSTAEFLFLLNPDARIVASDILKMADTMQRDRRWGALAPRVFWDPARRFLLPSALPMDPWSLIAIALVYRMGASTTLPAQYYLAQQRRQMAGAKVFATRFLVGAAMLVRREAAIRAGGLFDPDYFMFYEDSDLSLRLRRAGFRVGIEPGSTAVHEYRHKLSKISLMVASAQIYYAKRFPRFYRASGRLSRVESVAGKGLGIGSAAQELGTIDSARDLRDSLQGRRILALSPAPALMPALFRPLGQAPVAFDDDDWERLEPGRYWLCCAGISPEGQGISRLQDTRRWATFIKPGVDR